MLNRPIKRYAQNKLSFLASFHWRAMLKKLTLRHVVHVCHAVAEWHGHDLRFVELESFKEILLTMLEKFDCWTYRETPEECFGEMHVDDDYYPGVFVAWCDRHEHPEDYKKRQEAAGNWKDPRVWSLEPTDSLF